MILSSTLSTAITDNMTALLRHSLSAEPSTTLVVDDVRYVMSPYESIYFNLVMDARFDRSMMADRVRQLVNMFNKHGRPWIWMVAPRDYENGLASCLADHGLRKVGTSYGMAMELRHLSPDLALPEHLHIMPVKSIEDLKLWCDVNKLGFPATDGDASAFFSILAGVGFDQDTALQAYVGWVDGKPVATSAGFFGKDGIVGIYRVATLSEYRGKGIGTAMTLFPLLEAKKRGYSGAVLDASKMGHGAYQRLGFQDYHDSEVWMFLPSGETTASS